MQADQINTTNAGAATQALPIKINVNQWKIEPLAPGEVGEYPRSKNKTTLIRVVTIAARLEKGQRKGEWHIEVAPHMPTAVTFCELTDSDAKDLAAKGYDAGEYGGYHADVITYAEKAGLVVELEVSK